MFILKSYMTLIQWKLSTGHQSDKALQKRIYLSLCLSTIFPCLLKFAFQFFHISPQLPTWFATAGINDLPELLAHSFTRSFRRPSVPQHGLRSGGAGPNLNKLESYFEIAADMSGGGWLVTGERPANPMRGYMRSRELITAKRQGSHWHPRSDGLSHSSIPPIGEEPPCCLPR